MKTTVQFSKRELATVLASLRLWQHLRDTNEVLPVKADKALDLYNIATDNSSVEMLTPKSLDRLCERINTEGPLRIVVEVTGGVVDPVHVSHEAIVTVYDHDNIEAGDEPPCDLEKTTAELPHAY